ncbi:MAG: type II toxin-antitoxin system VapC family toxin [Pirellulales bacterium]|nr:type II toxin-antitoxin system VapC family toxin [Pirellulales bacterium]
MKILLDTHVFLWFISGSPRISDRCREQIQSPANDVYLSVASIWEIAVKHALGKLALPGNPAEFASQARQRHGIVSWPLTESAIGYLHNLPSVHRDPFDRLLVCQALQLGAAVATVDQAFSQYPVPLLAM